MKVYFSFLLLIIGLGAFGQQSSYSIKIIDSQKSPVSYATVMVNNDVVFVSDDNGFCNIKSETSKPNLKISHVAYEGIDTTLNLSPKFTVITLADIELQSIEVVAQKNTINKMVDGMTQLSRAYIEALPSLLGSSNFTMALRTLPGVQGTYDFSSSFVVRGGETDQNQVLIDHAPLYNLNHIGGIFPIVNNETVHSVNFYNGPIPANYGGRLSSTTMIGSRDPNMLDRRYKFRIGMLDADATIDLPIIKNKLSLISSNRFVHFLPITASVKFLYDRKAINNFVNLGFYDSHNKLVFKVNEKLKFSLLYFQNKDYFEERERVTGAQVYSNFDWGNKVLSLSTAYAANSKLILKSNVHITNYERNGGAGIIDSLIGVKDFTQGKISDVTLQLFADVTLKNTQLRSGIWLTRRSVIPSKYSTDQPGISQVTFSTLSLTNLGSFIDWTWTPLKKLTLQSGLRGSVDRSTNFTYYNVEPRVNVSYLFQKGVSIYASFARTRQSVFQIGGDLVGLNDEYWFQVDDNVSPQTARILSLGTHIDIDKFSSKTSVFSKVMSNLIDAQIGIVPSLYVSHDKILESININATGRAYGVEQWFNYTTKKSSLNLSYTYSRSFRTHPNIFDGSEFRSTFDRPHVLNAIAQHKLTSKLSLSANLLYQSGARYSQPTGYIQDFNKNPLPYYTARNNATIIPYHRLDLGLQRNWTSKKNREKALFFNIINVYNRKNVSFLYPKWTTINAQYSNSVITTKKFTLIPLMGSIAYSVSI